MARGKENTGSNQRKSAPRKAASISVLVVDDEKVMRDLFKRVLEVRGYSVTVAESGEQAVDSIRKNPFDVVFLDIVMPGMDGVKTLKAIKKVSQQTPVVMMTGFAVGVEIGQALKLGAEDCLRKPFDIVEIMRVIEKVLKRS